MRRKAGSAGRPGRHDRHVSAGIDVAGVDHDLGDPLSFDDLRGLELVMARIVQRPLSKTHAAPPSGKRHAKRTRKPLRIRFLDGKGVGEDGAPRPSDPGGKDRTGTGHERVRDDRDLGRHVVRRQRHGFHQAIDGILLSDNKRDEAGRLFLPLPERIPVIRQVPVRHGFDGESGEDRRGLGHAKEVGTPRKDDFFHMPGYARDGVGED